MVRRAGGGLSTASRGCTGGLMRRAMFLPAGCRKKRGCPSKQQVECHRDLTTSQLSGERVRLVREILGEDQILLAQRILRLSHEAPGLVVLCACVGVQGAVLHP